MSDTGRPIESSIPHPEADSSEETRLSRPLRTPGRLRQAFRQLRELFAAGPPLSADQITRDGLARYALDQINGPLKIQTQAKQGFFYDETLYSDYAGYHNIARVKPDVAGKIQDTMHSLAADGFAERQQVQDDRTGFVRMAWVITDPSALEASIKPTKS